MKYLYFSLFLLLLVSTSSAQRQRMEFFSEWQIVKPHADTLFAFLGADGFYLWGFSPDDTTGSVKTTNGKWHLLKDQDLLLIPADTTAPAQYFHASGNPADWRYFLTATAKGDKKTPAKAPENELYIEKLRR